MKIQFLEKKLNLPGNVRAYAEKKVTKLERYFREDAEALVAFSVEKNRNIVELTVHAANTFFRASESTSDAPYPAGRFRPYPRDRILLCARGPGGGGIPAHSDQAVPHEAHDPRRGDSSDESAGA